MFRIRLLILFLAFSLFQEARTQAQLFGSKNSSGKTHHTKVSLVSSVKSIQPGQAFTVGVLMKMDEGWHTYWRNAGEAGLPTEVKWKLPDGFAAGPIRWPVPHKYNESGDVLTYGYETENMLLVEIVPPAGMKPGSTVTLKANVNWLECEKLCVPGDAEVELRLPVTVEAPNRTNEELFKKYESQIPQPVSHDADISVQSDAKNGAVIVQIESVSGKRFIGTAGHVPDFYPESINELVIGRTKVDADEHRAVFRISLSAYEKVMGPLAFKGVILYQQEGESRRAATYEITLSREFCATIPLEGAEENHQQPGGLLDQTFTTIASANADQPLYLYFIFAILGGLLLNIMPCVLPVIGLKIFGLMRMSGDEPARVKRLGWFFSFGILASFLVLALLVIFLKTAGEQVGWGFQFQEPLFVIGMSAVVFAFGLSLFGVFEISLPFVLAFSGVGSSLERHDKGKGYLSSFSEGVFATVLATPCTAPFLGSAMGFAFSQPAHIILLLFASVALGMALPYLILTAKPKWMRFLPKPGEWMVTAKQFMGFLMMATLVWLLQVLGFQLGMEAVIWTTAFLLFVAMACWIIGRFATLSASRIKYTTAWVVALLLVVVGYQLFITDVLRARDILVNPGLTDSIESSDPHGVAWQPFSVEQLEANINENKTVFIDFTAEWCLTCKVNEKTVLTDRAVVEKFREENVVAMKADWTSRNEVITRMLQKFGRSGVPLYVVFPAGKPTEPIVLPEVITPGIVLEALARASGM